MTTSGGPLIVGIGGTTSASSSTQDALAIALASARDRGATTRMFGGAELAALPHYDGAAVAGSAVAQDLIATVRAADGLVIASPGYHGSISGLVKNAIDYLEATASDERVYLDGMPVGLIVTAYGWQATGSTLGTLRAIVHALRGWPTPLGAALKASKGLFVDGACTDPQMATQLRLVGRQVADFAQIHRRVAAETQTAAACGT